MHSCVRRYEAVRRDRVRRVPGEDSDSGDHGRHSGRACIPVRSCGSPRGVAFSNKRGTPVIAKLPESEVVRAPPRDGVALDFLQ